MLKGLSRVRIIGEEKALAGKITDIFTIAASKHEHVMGKIICLAIND